MSDAIMHSLVALTLSANAAPDGAISATRATQTDAARVQREIDRIMPRRPKNVFT
jgi:hypothetical protein